MSHNRMSSTNATTADANAKQKAKDKYTNNQLCRLYRDLELTGKAPSDIDFAKEIAATPKIFTVPKTLSSALVFQRRYPTIEGTLTLMQRS